MGVRTIYVCLRLTQARASELFVLSSDCVTINPLKDYVDQPYQT